MRLLDSEPDDVALVRAVEEKVFTIADLYFNKHGQQLQWPEDLKPAAARWRQCRQRHKASDFRHSEDELRATKEVAQWTLEVNAELRGQPKPKQHQWKEDIGGGDLVLP